MWPGYIFKYTYVFSSTPTHHHPSGSPVFYHFLNTHPTELFQVHQSNGAGRFVGIPRCVFLGGVDQVIPLMVQKSGDHQLRLVVYPIIYWVLYNPKWLFGISSINSRKGSICKTESKINIWRLWRLILWGYDIIIFEHIFLNFMTIGT